MTEKTIVLSLDGDSAVVKTDFFKFTITMVEAGKVEVAVEDEDNDLVDHLTFYPPMYENHYRCPECGTHWTDEWSSMCDDDCPRCGERHIEPYGSEQIEPRDRAASRPAE